MEEEKDNLKEFLQNLKVAAGELSTDPYDAFSILLGKPISSEDKKKIEETSNLLIKMINELSPKLNEIGKIQNQDIKKKEFIKLFEGNAFREYLKEIKTDESVIDYIGRNISPKLVLPEGSFLKETSYEKYREITEKLIIDIRGKIPFKTYSEYLDSVFSYVEDALSMGQMVIKNFNKMYKQLFEKRSRFTRKQAERDMAYYENLAGLYEKSIATIAGLVELLNGKTVNYSLMRKLGLANSLEKVENSAYRVLISGFSKVMRNSLGHRNSVYLPSKKCVKFIDRNKTLELTCKQVNEKTKDLYALYVAIYDIPIDIYEKTISSLK
jgi:hypothetical protein